MRRNSVLSDMLFVNVSHPLSPFIFSLSDRCRQSSEKKRARIAEKIDPAARSVMHVLLLSIFYFLIFV